MLYSPFWSVNIYDNADFNMVHDLASVQTENILAMGATNLNCPVVENESTSDAEPISGSFPNDYVLDQNYPNPFNPSTVIVYLLPVSSNVTLKVYDMLGNEVAIWVDEYKPAGSYDVEFSATGLASGIYFYQLVARSFVSTKKMILMK
jgi:hypothetical protein